MAGQEAKVDRARARCAGEQAPRPATVANGALFFRRWLRNPLQMGSIVPSSPALCRRVARQIRRAPDEAVLELGAGTGVISLALLAAGLPPQRLIVVEIVPSMAEHLRRILPAEVMVVTGDARALPGLLPRAWQGRIGTVVCGIPLVLLPKAEQARFIGAIDAVAPGRGFLHYSYCVTSPLPAERHALAKRREAWTPLNFPPASVWRYTPRVGRAEPGRDDPAGATGLTPDRANAAWSRTSPRAARR